MIPKSSQQARKNLFQAHCACVGRLLDLRHEVESLQGKAEILAAIDKLIVKTKNQKTITENDYASKS